MKKHLYLLFAVAIIVMACSQRPNPCLTFTTTPGSKVVSFSNCSTEASSYTWDDGDATFSFDTSPTHTYAASCTYTVILQAVGANDVFEEITKSVTV